MFFRELRSNDLDHNCDILLRLSLFLWLTFLIYGVAVYFYCLMCDSNLVTLITICQTSICVLLMLTDIFLIKYQVPILNM